MNYPNSGSASDIWSLKDVYKAVAGSNWPVLLPGTLNLNQALLSDTYTGSTDDGNGTGKLDIRWQNNNYLLLNIDGQIDVLSPTRTGSWESGSYNSQDNNSYTGGIVPLSGNKFFAGRYQQDAASYEFDPNNNISRTSRYTSTTKIMFEDLFYDESSNTVFTFGDANFNSWRPSSFKWSVGSNENNISLSSRQTYDSSDSWPVAAEPCNSTLSRFIMVDRSNTRARIIDSNLSQQDQYTDSNIAKHLSCARIAEERVVFCSYDSPNLYFYVVSTSGGTISLEKKQSNLVANLIDNTSNNDQTIDLCRISDGRFAFGFIDSNNNVNLGTALVDNTGSITEEAVIGLGSSSIGANVSIDYNPNNNSIAVAWPEGIRVVYGS